MVWCFGTRESVDTALSMHPCVCSCLWVNVLVWWIVLAQWDQDKMATMLQTTFSNAFSWTNFVPKGSIDHIPALFQIMVWHRPGNKPLSEPMMINLPTYVCVTRSQWVKYKYTVMVYAYLHLGNKFESWPKWLTFCRQHFQCMLTCIENVVCKISAILAEHALKSYLQNVSHFGQGNLIYWFKCYWSLLLVVRQAISQHHCKLLWFDAYWVMT